MAANDPGGSVLINEEQFNEATIKLYQALAILGLVIDEHDHEDDVPEEQAAIEAARDLVATARDLLVAGGTLVDKKGNRNG
ncbi:MAG TPA: hypothetical protein VED01_19510 [Burkholderiales bacterium]|nr:hypothetical protein [Burkholderiales bacterium]